MRHAGDVQLDPARARDAGGAVGRLAVLRARLAVARDPQPQHVHADRARHRRRLALQRRRDRCAGHLSRRLPRCDGAVAVYFEAAAVITVLVLLGQVLELRAREQTSGAIRALLDLAPEDGAPRARRRQRRGGRARRRRSRRSPAGAARREGAGRRRASSKAARRSTNRWSPANRCRSRRTPARTVIGGTINQTGSFVMRAEKVGRDTMLAQIVQMVGDGAALARADPAPGRSGRRLVRAGGDPRRASSRSSPGRCAGPSRGSPSAWSPRSRC